MIYSLKILNFNPVFSPCNYLPPFHTSPTSPERHVQHTYNLSTSTRTLQFLKSAFYLKTVWTSSRPAFFSCSFPTPANA